MLQKGIMKPTLELNRGFFPISTFIRLSTRVWKPDFKLWCTLAGNCVKLTGVKKFKFAELAYATITPNWASISNKNLYAMDTPFWAPILRKPTRKKGKMSIRESQRLIKRSCDPNCYSCFFLIFVISLTTKIFFPISTFILLVCENQTSDLSLIIQYLFCIFHCISIKGSKGCILRKCYYTTQLNLRNLDLCNYVENRQ